MTSEIDNLVERVARLERQNRQMKLLGLGIALGIAALLLTGAAKTPRTIEAERIIIRNRHGHASITLGTPAFAGAAIDTSPDDPMIWLSDDKSTDRAILATDGLRFANSKAKPTVTLRSDPDGLSELEFYGTDGKVSWSAP